MESPSSNVTDDSQRHNENPSAPAVNPPDHHTPEPATTPIVNPSSTGEEKPTGTETPKASTSTAQPKQKTTVEDDDDEDSEFDELDDVLDNFSKPSAAAIGAPTSQPVAPAPATDDDFDEDDFMRQLEQNMAKMMNHAAQESGAPDDKEFENAINDGADAFTKQLEESGIPPGDFIKRLLADVMAEEEGAGPSTAAVQGSAAGSGAAGGAGAGAAAPESFNDAIQRTIHRMKESGDKATAAVTEEGDLSEDVLMQLLKSLEAGAGAGDDDIDFTQMIAGMMEQFTNKEMLYEPMKELNTKWGPWMKENRGKVPAGDMERYEKQAKLVAQIVEKFEEKGYTDEDPKQRGYVWDRMQEMQALGSPPEELIANPWPEELGDGTGNGNLPSCPQQ